MFTLERSILAGLGLSIFGVWFIVEAVMTWSSANFGAISYPDSLRLVVPGVTGVVLGVETIFSGFFLSVLDLKHD